MSTRTSLKHQCFCLVLLVLISKQVYGQPTSSTIADTSCSEERTKAILEDLPEQSYVVFIKAKFEGDEELCGYSTVDTSVYPPKSTNDAGYDIIKEKMDKSPPCSRFLLEEKAVNKQNRLFDSVSKNITVQATVPDKVNHLEAELTEEGNINVNWDSSTNPCPVGNYKLTHQYTKLEDLTVEIKNELLNINITSALLTDLEPDAIYTICVACVSDEGEGPPHCVKIRTPARVLPEPRDLATKNATSSSFEVSWLPPAGDAPVEKYELSVAVAGVENAPVTKYTLCGLSHTVEGLQPSTEYLIEVGAIDSSGKTGLKNSTTAKTLADADQFLSQHVRELEENQDTNEIVDGMLKDVVDETKALGYNGVNEDGSSGGRNSKKVTAFYAFLTTSLALGVAVM